MTETEKLRAQDDGVLYDRGGFSLDIVANMLQALGQVGSTNEKKSILKRYFDLGFEEVSEYLFYVLNPYKMYNMTSKNINVSNVGHNPLNWDIVKNVLESLQDRRVSGNEAIDAVNTLLHGIKQEHINIFITLVDKDLGVGVGSSLVNSVRNIIPEFNPKLCLSYEDLSKLPFKQTGSSRKLDGVRVFAIKRSLGEGFRFFSREGREFLTLGNLKKALDEKFSGLNNIVFDGEGCIIDDNGKEDFTKIVSEIKRKNFTIQNPKYVMFDMITTQEFDSAYSDRTLPMRYKDLKTLIPEETQYFKVLEQTFVESPEQLERMAAEASDRGEEGLILVNLEAPYEGKRTKNLLKVKKFYDAEFKITGSQLGTGKNSDKLGALLIEGDIPFGKDRKIHKVISEVGSGFSDEQRQEYWNNRQSLIGQIVTVRFFDITQDKDAKASGSDLYSLRFPSFKVLHGYERTT